MINSFRDEYRFLSNFYPAKVKLDDLVFETVENAYQAAKCRDRADRLRFQHITPGQAKRLGNKVPLRSDWHDIRVGIMRTLIRAKFQHRDLQRALLDTGDQKLIEGNAWGDTFWGFYNGEGMNTLGKILMEVRQSLREEGTK